MPSVGGGGALEVEAPYCLGAEKGLEEFAPLPAEDWALEDALLDPLPPPDLLPAPLPAPLPPPLPAALPVLPALGVGAGALVVGAGALGVAEAALCVAAGVVGATPLPCEFLAAGLENNSKETHLIILQVRNVQGTKVIYRNIKVKN